MVSIAIALSVQGLSCGALLYLLWFLAKSDLRAQPLLAFFAATMLAFLVRVKVPDVFANKATPMIFFIGGIVAGIILLCLLMKHLDRQRAKFLATLR